jgi:polyisoprenoid-binding protein YceI
MKILVTGRFSYWTKTAAVLLLFSLGMLPWVTRAEALLCESFERAGVDADIIANMLGAANGGYLYQIDKDTSRVEFHVDYYSVGRIHGSFSEFEGGLSLSPATSKVNQALLLIRAGSLTTGNNVFDAIANGSGFFNTKRFPEMLFVSHGVRWESATTAKLFGDLTLLGQTRTIVFDINVSPISPANWRRSRKLIVKAKAMIKRSNFGINGYSGLVGDTVQLSIEFKVLRITA